VAYDVGDTAQPALSITDQSGAPVNAGAVTAVITLPDGTTAPGGQVTVTNPAVGTYVAAYVTLLAGWHRIVWTATGANSGVHSDGFDVLGPPERPGVVSLPDARRHLRLGVDTSRDDELRSVIEAATALCEDHTGRTYRRRTVVAEAHDGGRTAIVLRHSPVQSVTLVTVGGVASTSWVLDAHAGILYSGSTAGATCWPPGIQNVLVTYAAGDPVVSPRVTEAHLVTIQNLWDLRRGGSNLPRQTGAPQAPAAALPARAVELLAHDVMPGFA
jgi:hypothetical protein